MALIAARRALLRRAGGIPEWVPLDAAGNPAVLVIDMENDRGWHDGRAYRSVAALYAAIGGVSAGGGINVAPYEDPAGINYVSNGGFDTDTTGWTPNNATIQSIGGEGVVEATGNLGAASQKINGWSGRSGVLRGTGRRGTSAQIWHLAMGAVNASLGGQLCLSNQVASTSPTALEAYVAGTPNMWVGPRCSASPGSGTAIFDDIRLNDVRPVRGWNAASGCVGVVEFTTPGSFTGTKVIWQNDAGLETYRIRLQVDASGNLRHSVTTANLSVANLGDDYAALSPSTRYRAAWQVAASAHYLSLDGAAADTGTSDTNMGCPTLRIGRSFTGEAFDGVIHKIAFFNGAQGKPWVEATAGNPFDGVQVEGDSGAAGAYGYGLGFALRDEGVPAVITAVGGSTLAEARDRLIASRSWAGDYNCTVFDLSPNGYVDVPTHCALWDEILASRPHGRIVIVATTLVGPSPDGSVDAGTIALEEVRDYLIGKGVEVVDPAAISAGLATSPSSQDLLDIDARVILASQLEDSIHPGEALHAAIAAAVKARMESHGWLPVPFVFAGIGVASALASGALALWLGLGGAVAAPAVASGHVGAIRGAEGAASASSSAGGAVGLVRGLGGAASASAAAAGTVSATLAVAGAAAQDADTVGEVDSADKAITGAASAGASAHGVLTAQFAALGSAEANAAATGATGLSVTIGSVPAEALADAGGTIAAVRGASGSGAATASGEGVLARDLSLSGTATATMDAAGIVVAVRGATGAVAQSAAATGTVALLAALAGAVEAGASGGGAVAAERAVSGAAAGDAQASGSVARLTPASGAAEASAIADGAVSALRPIAGAAEGDADAGGAVLRLLGISGAATASASAEGAAEVEAGGPSGPIEVITAAAAAATTFDGASKTYSLDIGTAEAYRVVLFIHTSRGDASTDVDWLSAVTVAGTSLSLLSREVATGGSPSFSRRVEIWGGVVATGSGMQNCVATMGGGRSGSPACRAGVLVLRGVDVADILGASNTYSDAASLAGWTQTITTADSDSLVLTASVAGSSYLVVNTSGYTQIYGAANGFAAYYQGGMSAGSKNIQYGMIAPTTYRTSCAVEIRRAP